LINGVVADNATRKTASDIEAHLESLKPTSTTLQTSIQVM